MGRRWSVAHPSHGDARCPPVPAHHREHLRHHRRDWTGVRRDACSHRCDADRERVPPLLGLGSVEAHSSARNTSQGASRRCHYGSGDDDRGRCRILGCNRDSPRPVASGKPGRSAGPGCCGCRARPRDARQGVSACKSLVQERRSADAGSGLLSRTDSNAKVRQL